MNIWSATTGANIVAQFEKYQAEGKETRYRARANGLDQRGDQRFNEFTIKELVPQKSNDYFTTAKVQAIGVPDLELRIYHGSHYGVQQGGR